MKTSHEIGIYGENQAENYLISKNYEIICRNYRSRFGEIDIIAKRDEYLIFVEVKKRKNSNFGRASEYVTPKKIEKLTKTALFYLSENKIILQPRFDVLEIYDNEIIHIINAF